MSKSLTDKKIAVIGIGGVGGYLSGMLGQVCGHLTLIARGGRAEALKKNGLVLHSAMHGEIVSRPERIVELKDMGEQDYIFVCVKNFSLESVCSELKPFANDDTVIIPVMNGVDPGDRIRSLIGRGTVVDSLIYIVAFSDNDYSIVHQSDYAYLRIGIKNADAREARIVNDVSSILTAANVIHKAVADIEAEIWRKYIVNCAYNVETAYYDNNIGQLRDDPVKAKEYEALTYESYALAKAKGVNLTDDDLAKLIYRFYNVLADDSTSSLQRDVKAGKPAEVETFSGYVVKESRRLGLSAPVSAKMYEGLMLKTGGHT